VVRVTACTNQKGGVGKTTTVINLAAFLALSGTRTLVIDLDPQGNATSGLGVDRRAVDRSSYDALVERVPVSELVLGTPIEGLDLVPSSPSLSGAEVELVGVAAREHRLTASLAELNGRYDRVLIDCPPSLGLLTVNALTAADGVLIPIQTEYYALEGLSQLVNTIRRVREGLNPRLEIDGVLLTMYDARLNLCRQVANDARDYFGDKVLQAVIPRNVRLAEAPSFGKPVLLYDVQSIGAKSYLAAAQELMKRVDAVTAGGVS
jgi:chromosome partitioning protein